MSSTLASEDLQEDLQCPVCLKIPRTTPIFQCPEGHIHCKECHPKLANCPICRSMTLSIRALMIEKVIAKLPMKCVNADHGCAEEKKLLKDMKEHETKECNFRHVKCLFLACDETFSVCKAMDHMKEKHQMDMTFHKLNSRTLRLLIKDCDEDSTKPKAGRWCPYYFFSRNQEFLCKVEVTLDGFCIINMFILGSKKDCTGFSCNIKVISSNNEQEVISRGFINILGDENPDPSIILHPGQIRKLRNESDTVTFEITITSTVDVQKSNLEVIDTATTKFIRDCYQGKYEEVRDTVAELKPKAGSLMLNARARNKQTAFMLACVKGYNEIVNIFVQNAKKFKVDLNAQDEDGCTGLMLAVGEGHLDTVTLLSQLEANVDLNKKDKWGTTPFMYACHEGHIEIVQYFIKLKETKGTKLVVLHDQDEDGDTAFHYACKAKKGHIIDLLVNSCDSIGLELGQKNNDDKTGYDLMSQSLRTHYLPQANGPPEAKKPKLE